MSNHKWKKVDTTCRKDDNGNPFKYKRDAKVAREARLNNLRNGNKLKETKEKDIMLKDLWKHYLKHDSKDRATATVTKYSSLWKNHICEKFGNKRISEISTNDMNNYLSDLYLEGTYSYKYVESFLKMFYMLFALAYSMDMIDTDRFTKIFLNKKSRVHMPKMTQEDKEYYDNIETYTDFEIEKINAVMKDTNLYTSFLMALYLGLRVSEVFATRWQDIDWNKKTIRIYQQMNYYDKMFHLGEVKSLSSVREIDIPDKLHEHLLEKWKFHNSVKDNLNYHNNEIVIDDRNNKEQLVGSDFINRKEDGTLLTINSVKYWSKKVEEQTEIELRYHALRRTHLSKLAGLGVPPVELMKRAGHKKYETTMRYYIKDTKETHDVLLNAINSLNVIEKQIEITSNDGIIKIPEHVYKAYLNATAQIPH